MRRILIALCLLHSAPLLAAPTFVQGAMYPNSHGFNTDDYLGHLQNAVLSGNTIVVFAQAGIGATSVTDDKSNTYTQAGSTCTGNQALVAYVAKNVTNGPKDITVHWSTTTTFSQIAMLEFYNVDQTTPVDTMSAGTNPQCGTGTGTALTAGSGTPTTSGAMAVNFGLQDTTEAEVGAFTQGSNCGGFTMRLADITGGQMVQTAITSGACNADATQSPSNHWTSLALFLRPATAGTAPAASGIRILREQHHSEHVSPAQASPHKAQWPGTGSLWVLKWNGADPETITSITDTASNTWTQIGTSSGSGTGSGVIQAYFCVSCTASNTLTLTINFSGTAVTDSTWHLVDVTNFDTTFTPLEAKGTGNMTVGTTLTETTITPSSSNGLVIAFDGHASNNSLSCTTGFFNSAILTPTPATSPVDENNSNCNYYNPNTSNFVHQSTVDVAVGVWADKVLFFKAAGAAAATMSGRPLLGVGK